MRWLTFLLAVFFVGCASTLDTQLANADSPFSGGQGGSGARAMNHYLASVVYERTRQLDEAIGELRKASDLVPDSTALRIKLLGAYYLREDYENAEVMARYAIEKEPNNTLLHIWLGRIYYQLGDLDMAISTLQNAINLAPDSTLAYEALAEVEEEVNDLVGAARIYEKLAALTPDSAFLQYQLGVSLARINDNEPARAALVRAMELNPELIQAAYPLGVLYLDAGEFERSAEQFEAFLRRNPINLSARVNLAAALCRLSRFDEAIRHLTVITESGRADPRHHIERMFLMLWSGKVDDVSLAIAPNGAPFMGMLLQALIRRQEGEPYRTIVASLATVEGDLDDECSTFINNLLMLFGDETAGTFLETQLRALRKDVPDSRVVDIVLARTLMSMDHDEEAKTVLLEVLEKYEPEKWIHYYLGVVYEDLGQAGEVEKHLRACLEFDPNDPDVLNFLGYMFAEEDIHLGEAKKLLEKALEIDPENGFYLDSLGWILYRKGDSEGAIDLIRRAIRAMATDDAVLRDHLGDAYLLGGQVEKAVAEWQRALRLDSKLEGVEEKLGKHLKRLGE